MNENDIIVIPLNEQQVLEEELDAWISCEYWYNCVMWWKKIVYGLNYPVKRLLNYNKN